MLKRGLPVIPVLIDHIRMPTEADLPPSLVRLAYRNALRVCSKSPMLWSVSVVACTETDPGTSPRSADGASTESC